MNGKDLINQRFIIASENVLQNQGGLNKGRLAKKLGLSASTFSEILKKRMNVGVDTIAKLCELFDIRAEWMILGKGSMNVHKEEPGPVSKFSNDEVYIIELQKKLIKELEDKIYRTKGDEKLITKLAKRTKNAP